MDAAEPYALVDEAIEAWANSHSLTLFREFAGRSARFCYISSAAGECLQISIEPPQGAAIEINVTDVETIGDVELSMTRKAQLRSLRDGLDAALSDARAWLAGERRLG